MMKKLRNFTEQTLLRVRGKLTDSSGVGVVETILILVVLVALVVIFKSQLTSIVSSVFREINADVSTILQ